MDDFKPPDKLSFEGDVSQNWKKWRQMFEFFIDAKDVGSKADKVKIGMLLSAMGSDGIERFNHFSWAKEEDKNNYDEVIKMFESVLSGEKRIVYNRYKFWDYKRPDQQPFDE